MQNLKWITVTLLVFTLFGCATNGGEYRVKEMGKGKKLVVEKPQGGPERSPIPNTPMYSPR